MLLVCLCVVQSLSCKKKADNSQIINPNNSLGQDSTLPRATLTINNEIFIVELALTCKAHRQGLMFREDLLPNRGMLFVFEEIRTQTMHMKNCLIDIDVVFIKPDGKIAKIVTMKAPVAGEPVMRCSSDTPIQYALELPAGTAIRLSLLPGQTINIPQEVEKLCVREEIDEK
jgi:uncharacterized membrane protein (UPF0127 family)